MLPIHQLLHRIQHDAVFAQGEFEVGFFDRVEKRIIRMPLREFRFSEDSPNSFQFLNAEGRSHRVPFHRIREVYKDGQRIWAR
jgi:uncharacterized protein (UPF0248 family)